MNFSANNKVQTMNKCTQKVAQENKIIKKNKKRISIFQKILCRNNEDKLLIVLV